MSSCSRPLTAVKDLPSDHRHSGNAVHRPLPGLNQPLSADSSQPARKRHPGSSNPPRVQNGPFCTRQPRSLRSSPRRRSAGQRAFSGPAPVTQRHAVDGHRLRVALDPAPVSLTLSSFGRCRSGCERPPDWVCAFWARAWFAAPEPDRLMCALSACRRRGGCPLPGRCSPARMPGQGARCRAQSRLNEALAPHGHPCWQRRQRRCCGGERDAPDHRGRDHDDPDQAEAHRRADQARLAGRRTGPPGAAAAAWSSLAIRTDNPLRGERACGLVLADASRRLG